jgi:hypothetical protein
MRLCDELDFGFGWIDEEGVAARTSHALAAGGGVWLFDPVDMPGLDDRIRKLGEPWGVVRLLDRHGRDCGPIARRLGVPLHHVPFDGIPDSPFDVIRILRIPGWREIAVWLPERRVLVAGDALGTLTYFREPGETLGIHPALRLTPPRRLFVYDPLHVLVGHGAGVHGESAGAHLRRALGRSRRGLPAALAHGIRAARRD